MKPLTLAMMSAVLASVAAAEESPSTTPKARVRLDPVTRTAVADPGLGAQPAVAGSGSVVVMDRYVVKDKAALPLQQPEPPETTGTFTFKDGGRFYGKELGPMRVEVGFWKNIDILADDARFTEGPKVKQLFDFVRIKW